MNRYPLFLSVVAVVRNQARALPALLAEMSAPLSALVTDYELIVVDNASQDDSVAVLKALTAEGGLPNLQVYALTKEVDSDTASWVGLESALGDFVAVIDPMSDDISFLETMLDHAVAGSDVVFAANEQKPRQSLAYRICFSVFNRVYRRFVGIDISRDAPNFRVVSKQVVNFILRHPMPSLTYRHLPATGGFTRTNLRYSSPPRAAPLKRLGESIDRGMRLLVTTTRGPMRLVTSLSLFGAIANVVYSAYVIAVALFKSDVAPGWVTLSLQQSGMFLLLSLVLLVLGEYILQMASLSNEGPSYHVAQEFASAVITRREKLNVEEVHAHGNRRVEGPATGQAS
jgi:polyisoprenyl-phosphate glycosyltransferase